MNESLQLANNGNGPRAWIVIALGEDLSPYDDRDGYSYQYDSKVQYHKQVRAGDLFFVRSRTGLQGAGRIRRIEVGFSQKEISRCPQCDKALPGKAPRFEGKAVRCPAGHSVSAPRIDRIDVKTFRALFDGEWVTMESAISAVELRRFALSNSKQLSITPANFDQLVDYVSGWSPSFRERVKFWTGRASVLTDYEASNSTDLTPEGEDRRTAALRSIRLRRGQRDFRDALISRYDARCAISGCSVLGVLEAAHLRPYRGVGDNHPSNGLLLRSDLHTLFDLNLIGIEPTSFRVVLSEMLNGSEYEKFRNVQLALCVETPPDAEALRQRWNFFCSAHLPYAPMLAPV